MVKVYINGRFLTQPITGVQRFAHEVTRQWDRWLTDGQMARDRWEVEVLVPPTGVIHEPRYVSIPLRPVGRLSGNLWEQVELASYSADGLLYCPCNTAPMRALVAGQPAVVMVHDLSYRFFPEAYSSAFRLWYDVLMPVVFQNARRVVTGSIAEKNQLVKQFPHAADKLCVVHSGSVPADAVGWEGSTSPVDGPYILYVGSLSRRKNVQGIVSAAEILLKRFRSLKCVFVGGQAKVLAESDFGTDASVVDRLVFVGQIDSTSELFRYYRHASCFVFPSFYEASPMPPTEAMSAGCPVVASAIPPHHERLGDAALYCQPRDANDIARKVAMVLEDAGVRDGLIAKGLKRASEFAWDRAALETLRIIDDVVRTDPAFNRAA